MTLVERKLAEEYDVTPGRAAEIRAGVLGTTFGALFERQT